MQKTLINIKNWDENKKIVEEIENRISDLEDEIKRMSKKEKKDKNANETVEIIKEILYYNEKAQKFFHRASKVDKRKSKSKIEESIAERIKLRGKKLDMVAKKKKNINNELFSYYFNYPNPEIMFKKLKNTSDERNKNLVESINKKLTKLKKIV